MESILFWVNFWGFLIVTLMLQTREGVDARLKDGTAGTFLLGAWVFHSWFGWF